MEFLKASIYPKSEKSFFGSYKPLFEEDRFEEIFGTYARNEFQKSIQEVYGVPKLSIEEEKSGRFLQRTGYKFSIGDTTITYHASVKLRGTDPNSIHNRSKLKLIFVESGLTIEEPQIDFAKAGKFLRKLNSSNNQKNVTISPLMYSAQEEVYSFAGNFTSLEVPTLEFAKFCLEKKEDTSFKTELILTGQESEDPNNKIYNSFFS